MKQVLETEVFIVTTEEYVGLQPKIADGASQLLLAVFGENGRSDRKLLEISSIPLHAPPAVKLLLESGGVVVRDKTQSKGDV